MIKIRYLLIGIAILGVAGLLLFPSIPYCGPTKESAEAKNDAVSIAQAISFYKTEFGVFPTGDFSQIIGTLSGNNPLKIVFLDLDPLNLKFRDGVPIDPWGNQYKCSTGHIKPHVWSIGKDGIDQQGEEQSDDQSSWN